ncbi:MAG TPA: hypothetical protein DCZ72_01280 [Armatimonadetes bacterium]|nr:hypothetical protein [Armatimonadota bacterium]
MLYGLGLTLAVGFGLPLAAAFGAMAQGKTASAALESIARQPEASGKIQTAMIIALALIESLVIYCLLAFFMMNGKLEAPTAVAAAAAPAAAVQQPVQAAPAPQYAPPAQY